MRNRENKGRNLKVIFVYKDRHKHVKDADFSKACLTILGGYSFGHPLISLGADQNLTQWQAKDQNILTEQ